MKNKALHSNHKPHVNKIFVLRKATMKRSKLKNKANRTKPEDDITNYEK